jgi:hypothetical protein
LRPLQNVRQGSAIKAGQAVLLSYEKAPKRLFLTLGLGRSERPAPEFLRLRGRPGFFQKKAAAFLGLLTGALCFAEVSVF